MKSFIKIPSFKFPAPTYIGGVGRTLH